MALLSPLPPLRPWYGICFSTSSHRTAQLIDEGRRLLPLRSIFMYDAYRHEKERKKKLGTRQDEGVAVFAPMLRDPGEAGRQASR